MPVALKKLWIRLTSDRRRFGALCIAVAAGMLLWARVIIIAKVPRQAIADDPMAQATPDRPAPAPDNSQRPRHEVSLDEQPGHDPFLISGVHFPTATSLNGLNRDAGKLGLEPVEDSHRSSTREYTFIRGLAELFELDAVMTGSPMAMISGRTYRMGEDVPAIGHPYVRFRLVEVKQRSVVLVHGRHRFELKIAVPSSR